jgi:hypothetical protein
MKSSGIPKISDLKLHHAQFLYFLITFSQLSLDMNILTVYIF